MTDTQKLSHLTSLVRLLLNDLPSNRNWLDPQIERELRIAVNAKTPSSDHRALIDRWKRNGMC
jgi:hypothetical protein